MGRLGGFWCGLWVTFCYCAALCLLLLVLDFVCGAFVLCVYCFDYVTNLMCFGVVFIGFVFGFVLRLLYGVLFMIRVIGFECLLC